MADYTDVFWHKTEDVSFVDADDIFEPHMPIVIADSGTGTDAVVLSASSIVALDSGTGTDAIDTIQEAVIEITETLTGTETAEIQATSVIITDSGSGTDVPTVPVVFVITDSLAGTDSVVLTQSVIVLADTLSGTDLVDATAATWVDQDGFDWVDADDVWVPHELAPTFIEITDSFTATEEISTPLKTVVIADSGTGIDEVISPPFLWVDATDAFIFVEDADFEWVEHETLAGEILDSVTGTDAVELAALATVADSGGITTLIETLGTFLINVFDSGTFADVVDAFYVVVVLDTITGTDAEVVAVSGEVTDSVTGTDVPTGIPPAIVITDSFEGTDLALVLALDKEVLDSGQGTDLVSRPSVVIEDSVAGTEAIELVASVLVTDSGTGTSLIGDASLVLVIDTVAGIDTLAIEVDPVVVTDGYGGDEIYVRFGDTDKQVVDLAYGFDIVLSAVAADVQITDSGAFTEAIEQAASILAVDTGTGTEELVFLSALVIEDSVSGVDVAGAVAALVIVDSLGLEADFPVVAVLATVTDSGTVADLVAVTIRFDKVVPGEAGVFTDYVTAGPEAIVILDTGQWSDLTGKDLYWVRVLDSGTGSEVIAVIKTFEIILLESGIFRHLVLESDVQIQRVVNE